MKMKKRLNFVENFGLHHSIDSSIQIFVQFMRHAYADISCTKSKIKSLELPITIFLNLIFNSDLCKHYAMPLK